MTVEESHLQVAKMPKSARHEASSPEVRDFTTRHESHFQTVKMMKSSSPEGMYSSGKVLMTLE
jgi:hypothetical protein